MWAPPGRGLRPPLPWVPPPPLLGLSPGPRLAPSTRQVHGQPRLHQGRPDAPFPAVGVGMTYVAACPCLLAWGH